jgi:nitroreductase
MTELTAFDDVVRERRSIRGFLPKPVPQALIEKVLTQAQLAPSNCNAQPWVVHVVSGKTLQTLRERLIEAAKTGKVNPDVPLTDTYKGVYRERRIGAAKALFEATGVGRNDMEARTRSFLRNFEMFDAPHALFLFMPSYQGLREAADVGMYAQTLMLALTANGLGSCAQGALSHQMHVVRDLLKVDDELICLFGISFGYPDHDHPSDAARTDRAPLSENVIFYD